MKKSRPALPEAFEQFWRRAPLLYYGLFLVIGAGLAQGKLFLLYLLIPLGLKKRSLAFGMVALGLGALLVRGVHQLPDLEGGPISGEAIVKVTRVSKRRGSFGEVYALRAKLHSFVCRGERIASNIPVSLYLPSSSTPPACDTIYQVSARLAKGRAGYILKSSRGAQWKALRRVWTLCQRRHAYKSRIREVVQGGVRDRQCATLLTGLLCGDVYDQTASLELSRFGLAHLVAISGLHFALVALAARALLRPLLPHRLAHVLLICGLAGYYLFIDGGPASLRAFTMACVFLFGELLGRRSVGCNSLGGALIVCLVLDPLSMTSLGFIFSFCCAGSILLFYPLYERLLRKVMASLSLASVLEMPFLDQHLFVVTACFRRALSLSLAVNSAALPLTLLYFHRFPLLGLAYNLIFPFVIGVALIASLLALPLALLSQSMARPLFWLAEHSIQLLLVTVREFPARFAFTLRIPHLGAGSVALLLTALFSLGALALSFRWKQKSYLPIA